MSSQGIHHRRIVQRVVFHLASLVCVLVLAAAVVLEARVHGDIVSIGRLSARLSLDTLVSRALSASLVSTSSVLLGAGCLLGLGLNVSLKLGLGMLLLRVGLSLSLSLSLGVSMSLLGGNREHTSRRGRHAGNNGNGNGGGALTGSTRNNRGRNRGHTRTGGSCLRDRSGASGGLALSRVLLLLGATTSRSRPPGDGVKSWIYPPVGVRRGGWSWDASFGLVLGAAKSLEVLSAVGMLAHAS